MKNDLTQYEKQLLRQVNFLNNTTYSHKNFMEWSNSRVHVDKNLKEGEIVYEVKGIYIAIKPTV